MADKDRDIKIIPGEYTGRQPRPVKRIFDVIFGVLLAASPLWSLFTYKWFVLPSAGFGIVYMIVQRLINRGEPGDAKRRVSMGLRIFAGVFLALLIVVVSGIGSSWGWSYSLRKSLYRIGNSIDAKELEFMPDSLPSERREYQMRFSAPSMLGSADSSAVRISFFSDEEGVSQLREAALSKGGELVEADSFVHKKLRVFCEDNSQSVNGAEVYKLGEPGAHCPAYLVNPETGLCVIYW